MLTRKAPLLVLVLLLITFVSADTIITNNGINTTGNITADWLFAKLNHSYIQNMPSYLTSLVNWSQYPAVSNISIPGYTINMTNGSIVDVGNIQMILNTSTFSSGRFLSTLSDSGLNPVINPGVRTPTIGGNSGVAAVRFINLSGGSQMMHLFGGGKLGFVVGMSSNASGNIITEGVTMSYSQSEGFVVDTTLGALNNRTTYRGDIYANGNYNATGNYTGDWGWMKINWSKIQNAPAFSLASDVWTAISGNWSDLESRKLNATDQRYNDTSYIQGQINNLNTSCVTSKEYIVYSDNAAPPNGFLPYGTSATVAIDRGYPVLYPMEITAITTSNSANVQCVGADVNSSSCKIAPTFNQSGAAINPFNFTFDGQKIITNITSINLTVGDSILVRGFGNVVSNGSSQGIVNVIVQFEAKRRC